MSSDITDMVRCYEVSYECMVELSLLQDKDVEHLFTNLLDIYLDGMFDDAMSASLLHKESVLKNFIDMGIE